MRFLLIAVCVVAVLAGPAAADTFTVTVPGALNSYYQDMYFECPFDFGQTFSEISFVEFHFVGSVNGGVSHVNWYDPVMGYMVYDTPVGGSFLAQIVDSGSEAVQTWPAGGPYSEFLDQWHMVPVGIDGLLDGQGIVRTWFCSETDPMASYTDYATGSLSNFEISITGTPTVVPEPASATCITGSLLSIFFFRRRK